MQTDSVMRDTTNRERIEIEMMKRREKRCKERKKDKRTLRGYGAVYVFNYVCSYSRGYLGVECYAN